MKRLLSLCAAIALAVGLVGCGGGRDTNTPSVGPANVQRVDPMQPKDGETKEQASPTDAKVDLTRNFYLVFDGSGSMSGSRIRSAKQATKAFLAGLPNDVNIGLYVFDRFGQGERVALGPNNKAAVTNAVDNINDGGGTPLGAGIRAGTDALVKQFRKQLGYGDYRLIVITDGVPDSESDMTQAVQEALKFSMPICTIGINLGPDHPLRKNSLSYKDTENAAELQQALAEAAAELESFDANSFKK